MKDELVIFTRPKSNISEDIRTIRTNLQFTSADDSSKVLLVTSSVPGEGKSFISSNLGAAFAQTGESTLIIDSDLRLGRIHKIFGVSNKKGLSNLLVEQDVVDYSEYIKKTDVDNLYIIPRGVVPPNPSELLNSKKNKELIKSLKEQFDVIIFDGVPCNGLPDSIIMSTLVDKVLIVSSNSVTPKSVLEATKKSLEQVGAPIAGDVLNNIDKKGSTYGRYYSYYGDSNR